MWLLRRALGLIPTIWLAVTLSFAALQLVPGDPAAALLAPSAPPEVVQAERHALGLDQPVLVRYVQFLVGLAQGDLGVSWASHEPVARILADAVPSTLQLAATALAIALAAGLGLGSLAALARGSGVDRATMGAALLGVSTPVIASGVLALALFAPALGGSGRLLLPALVLGVGSAGALARLTRAQLIETYGADFLRTARAKGLPERLVFSRHAVRNALIPVVSAAGLQFGFLLGGTVVTEMVFSRAGLGQVALTAILAQDLPVVQGVVVFGAAAYAVVNTLADVIHTWLDPRLRQD